MPEISQERYLIMVAAEDLADAVAEARDEQRHESCEHPVCQKLDRWLKLKGEEEMEEMTSA